MSDVLKLLRTTPVYSGESNVVGAKIVEAAVVVGGAVVVSGAAGFGGVRITLWKIL